jgi:hypothetical protein
MQGRLMKVNRNILTEVGGTTIHVTSFCCLSILSVIKSMMLFIPQKFHSS